MKNNETLKIEKEFQHHDKDTGSIEVQIIRMTDRINKLSEHFKVQSKDNNSKRGLTKLVNQRRKMLDYLKRKNENLYMKLIGNLDLRK